MKLHLCFELFQYGSSLVAIILAGLNLDICIDLKTFLFYQSGR